MVTFLRKFILFIVGTFFTGQLFVAQQYSFINYTLSSGLPNSNILSILQDSRGFLWIGTATGIASFNGEVWRAHHRSLKIKSVPIYDIFEDKNDHIWFAAGKNGAYVYTGQNTQHFGNEELDIISICEDTNGNILFATKNKGVYKLGVNANNLENELHPLNLTTNSPDFEIFHMMKDKDANIWLGTDKGLFKYDGISVKEYNLFNGLPHNKVTRLFEDNLSQIWFCTPRGVVKYDYNKFQVFNMKCGLQSNQINTISQDASGTIWMGGQKGIDLLNGEKIEHISTQNGLIDEHINIVQPDNSGNIWIGTQFGGISMFPGYAFTKYSITEGLISNQVFSIGTDNDNNLYIGTLNGVNSVSFPEIKHKNFENLNVNGRINKIFVDKKDRVWFGTEYGLYLKNSNNITKINQFDSLNISAVCQDKTNSIWVLANNQLYVEKKELNPALFFERMKNLSYRENIPVNNVKAIFSDNNGNIIVSFLEGGLAFYDGKNNAEKIKDVSDFRINSVAVDHHKKIWCGTEYNGLIIIEKKNGKWQIIKELNPETGLFSSKINSILFLDENSCLLGTNRGISNVYFDSDLNIINQKKVGLAEGINSVEPTNNALIKTSEGKILIGSLNGLIVYDPLQEELNLTPPNTHITSVKLFFKEVNWSKSNYSAGQNSWFETPVKLNLPPNQNHITFSFMGINLKSQAQVRYQWKLSPLELNWSPPGTKNEITYSELPPGDYTFNVKSYNEDGTGDIEPAVFKFSIRKPFYNTSWFIAIVILFFMGFGFVTFRWRTRKLKKAKEKLEKEVAKRTSQLRKEKELVEEQNKKIMHQAEELEAQTDKLFQYTALLETQHQGITDSINYARTIQKAVLGSRNLIRKIIPKAFVLYIPKDIVSGDFYWFTKKGDYIYVAAADCTGHGVPGAFMSIIGYNLLKETITESENQTAGMILDKLNTSLIELLSTHKTKGFSKNGMDMALLRINIEQNEVNFAGAKRPLYHLKNGLNPEIEVIKACRYGIGDEKLKGQDFKDHFIDLVPGDRYYLFTDGFIDQFGGDNDKKFLGKRFKDLLISLKDIPLKENETKLYDAFTQWKGLSKEQTDDILIIGLEF